MTTMHKEKYIPLLDNNLQDSFQPSFKLDSQPSYPTTIPQQQYHQHQRMQSPISNFNYTSAPSMQHQNVPQQVYMENPSGIIYQNTPPLYPANIPPPPQHMQPTPNFLQYQGTFSQLPQSEQIPNQCWYSNSYYQNQNIQLEQDRQRVENEIQRQEEEEQILKNKKKEINKKRKVKVLMDEFNELFPGKQASVVLLEYSQKSKIDFKIDCEQGENGLGFCGQVMLKGIKYSKRLAKSKKEAKEAAAMEALLERCECDDELKVFLEQAVEKERKVQKKFEVKEKNSRKSQEEDSEELDSSYDAKINYRDKVTNFVQNELKMGVNFEVKGEANKWEAICLVGSLIMKGKGITKKEAKNAAAFSMFSNLQNEPKTIQKLSKKAIQKEAQQKLKELEKLKSQILSQNEIQKIQEEQQELQEKKLQEEKDAKKQETALMEEYSCTVNDEFERQELLEITKRSKIQFITSHLNSFEKRTAVGEDKYNELKEMVNIIQTKRDKMKEYGLIDICVVGSYELNLIRKNKIEADVIINFKQDSLFKSQINDKISQWYADQAIEETSDSIIITNRKNPNSNNGSTLKLILNPINVDTSNRMYPLSMHHTLFMNSFKPKIQSNVQILTLLKFFRQWKIKNQLKIDTAIIDFILYAVTDQFTLISSARTLIQFFEFVANDGLEDVCGDNLRNIDVTLLHLEMIQSISEEHLEEFKKLCKEVFCQNSYIFLKDI